MLLQVSFQIIFNAKSIHPSIHSEGATPYPEQVVSLAQLLIAKYDKYEYICLFFLYVVFYCH